MRPAETRKNKIVTFYFNEGNRFFVRRESVFGQGYRFFVVRLKFQKRRVLKFVSRTIPVSGFCMWLNSPASVEKLF